MNGSLLLSISHSIGNWQLLFSDRNGELGNLMIRAEIDPIQQTVGRITTPVNKFVILAPYMALAVLAATITNSHHKKET